ncbi:dihydrolipoyl dehydrogenase [uncultured Algimonas sp.]|uniref:dihydrolipoyl dehydrogenase n=1 Tax=uncultured Algimonas sp. TaxID=1547920 RepID=UPI00262E2CB0|nr:dihydrolipoyl dehydrogenase [uncultured Algimonas sp.]
MADTYDVIIIGGGPGGYNCAIRCGQLGLKVACVETRAALGGTCLNVGCIPSKALLHATELYETAADDFEAMGMSAKVSADVPKMIEKKEEVVDGLTKGIAFLFKKNKVDHIQGFGKIVGKGKVDVDGKTYQAKNIVVATGSEVASLPFIDIDEKKVVSSTGALELKSVPKRMIVIGGGVIGLELGSVWRRLGADVTVIEYLDQILPGMDMEVRKTSARIFKKQGMKFELGRKVTAVDGAGKTVKIESEAAKGSKEKSFEADVVLVAIGRKPYTDGLGLDSVGVETTERGFIKVDHWKAADGVYAIGDVIEGPMLAHKAEEEGVAVAETIAGQSGHVNYGIIPGVVYTFPEIANVGKTEEELKEEGVPYKVGKFPLMANSRARCNHETDGFAKIIAHAETDEILGGHIIAPGAGDMIHEICLGMEFRAASQDIARTCHAHPTLSEAVRQAAMGVEGWTMQA